MAENLANPGSIEQTLLGKIPKHTFTIPDDIRDDKGNLLQKGVRELATDPVTVTMRQLTYAEELQALQASETRKTPYQYEGALRALVSADGKNITWTNNEKETFFAGLSQACRELILRGFSAISLPTVGATTAFLASEKVTVD
jgi:hypothetical protein